MKAHINGITIEGTPQEIADYMQLQEVKVSGKPQASGAEWLKRQMELITSGQTQQFPDITPDTLAPRIWGSALFTTIDEKGNVTALGPSIICE